jgi:hypothetical protein
MKTAEVQEQVVDSVFEQNGRVAVDKVVVPKNLNVEVTVRDGRMVFIAASKPKNGKIVNS